MTTEFQRALDFIEAAEGATDARDLQQRLSDTLIQFGIPHYTVGAMVRNASSFWRTPTV